MSNRKLLLSGFIVLALGVPSAKAQILLGGGQGGGFSWPRNRAYRDFTGQSYVDRTPNGRTGYFVNLGIPGYDDIGNGPSMAYSPIFNAPAPLPPPGTPPATRPQGLFRRWRGR